MQCAVVVVIMVSSDGSYGSGSEGTWTGTWAGAGSDVVNSHVTRHLAFLPLAELLLLLSLSLSSLSWLVLMLSLLLLVSSMGM